MRRPDTKEDLCRLVDRLRTAMSDIVLRTTLIVGFPGETQAEFDELVEFVRWARFEALGVFTYFPEAGTPAAEFPDQVPDEVKQARLEELMLTQQEIAFARKRGTDRQPTDVPGGRGRDARPERQAGDADPQSTIRNPRSAGDVSTARPRTSTVSALSRGARPHPAGSSRSKVTGTQDYDLVVEQI